MNHAILRLALIAGLAATSLFAGSKPMTGVPLEWKPTSTLAESMGALNLLPLSGAKIWIEPFTYDGADAAIVGENREDEEKPLTISTKDDVAAFLGKHGVELYREAGLTMASKPDEATVIVSVAVNRCKVVERDTYKGELSLLLQVRAGGAPIWRGTVLGEATRWGRSYKLENYYEALSDSLVDAIGKSLKSDSFLKALAGKGEPAPAASTAPAQ